MLFLAIPLTFGIIAVSDNFVQWFLGPGFEKVAIILKILSLSIIPATIIDFFGYQYLIPNNKNKEYSISVSIGAVVCIGLNFVSTIWLQSVGASITLVIVELIIMFCILFFSKEKIGLFKNIDILKYLIVSLFMLIVIILMNAIAINSILLTLIQLVFGLSFYIVSCYLLKCEIFNHLLSKFQSK
jgi:O-antigen/teichoic acid export membrane protein